MPYKLVYNPISGQFDYVPSATIVTFRASVATVGDLPTVGNTFGDGRITNDTGHLYVWDGEAWNDQGDIIDLKWEAIEGKPSSSTTDIDDAVSKKHSQNTDTIILGTGELVDQSQLTMEPLNYDLELTTPGYDRTAQTFIASQNLTLTAIELYIYLYWSTADLRVEIRTTDVNGKPTSTVLAYKELLASEFTQDSYVLKKIVLDTPISLVQSTKYAIVVINTGNYQYYVGNDAVGGYANGDCYKATAADPLVWDVVANRDFYFKVYYSSSGAEIINSGTLKSNLTVDSGITIDGRDISADGAVLNEMSSRLAGTSGTNTGDQSASDFDIKDLADSTNYKETLKTYCGFENRNDSEISINSGTGVFTLSVKAPATSFNIYANYKVFSVTSSKTVTVTEDQTITYIYIDGNGNLQKSTTAWDIYSVEATPCAIVFKDGSNYAITDERHGHERNKMWHSWAHENIGAMYHSGLSGTFADESVSIAQGIIADEDIAFDTVSAQATTTLWYRNAASGMRMLRGYASCKGLTGGILAYDNGSGTLQEVTNTRYVTNWVYASNDSTEPIYTVIGQNNSSAIAAARNATAPTINLSTAEWKLIYRVIYRRTTAKPGGEFIEAADFRTVQTGVPTSAISSDHAALINRDAANSHPANAITGLSFTADKTLTVTEDTTLSGGTHSGSNTGDQSASDFDIKDLTDSTSLRTTWSAKLDDISGESVGDLADVNDTGKATGKVLKYNAVSGDWEIGDDSNTLYTAGSGLTLSIAQFSFSYHIAHAFKNTSNSAAAFKISKADNTSLFNVNTSDSQIDINALLALATTNKIQFRDAAIHIASLDDGHLDLTADTSIDLNGKVGIGADSTIELDVNGRIRSLSTGTDPVAGSGVEILYNTVLDVGVLISYDRTNSLFEDLEIQAKELTFKPATGITIGSGAAGVDYTLTFDGETNDGVITWMEDEDYFSFSDDILLATAEKVYFRETTNSLHSSAVGFLDLTAASAIVQTVDSKPLVKLNKRGFNLYDVDVSKYRSFIGTASSATCGITNGVIVDDATLQYVKTTAADIGLAYTLDQATGEFQFWHAPSGVTTVPSFTKIMNLKVGGLTIGGGAAGVDYTLTVDGETNDGVITWMEGEDYFKFSDSILMDSTEPLYFRDTAIGIASLDDGHLDLTADTSVDINSVLRATDDIYLEGQKELRFYEGANYIGFEAPALAADQIWVLPAEDGNAGDVVTTDGAGNLSWSPSSSASGDALIQEINQAAHGLAVGDVVYFDGSDYLKAKADDEDTSEVIGIVSAVEDVDNFTLTTAGKVEGLAGLTTGTTYFLSRDTAGALTATEPTVEGSISKPLLIATSATTGVFFNFRGTAISDNATYLGSFVDGDLAAGILTVTHNLGMQYCSVVVADNTNKVIIPDEITYTDAASLEIDLSSYVALTGTWRFFILAFGSSAGGDLIIPSEKTAHHTLALADRGKLIEMNDVAALNVTVPHNDAVPFPVGTQITIVQEGAGTVTIVPAADVTVNSPGAALEFSGQYSFASLIKVGDNIWYATGNLV